MIRSTFSFLPGIDDRVENNLRLQGIKDWNGFLNSRFIKGLSPKRKYFYDRQIVEMKKAIAGGDASTLAQKIPLDEHWKLYDHFKEEAVFLDIETTGLGELDQVTVVGLFDGFATKTMVQGVNLDAAAIAGEMKNYKMYVTFNGSVFDVPFIEKQFPGTLPKLPHFDLRFACKKVGLTGGLKEIEKKLGISRDNPLVQRMHGGDAVTLWRMYKATGDEHYLKLLIDYNEEDIVNLKTIADVVYSRLSDGIPLSPK